MPKDLTYPNNNEAQEVVLIDPTTGSPYTAASIANAMQDAVPAQTIVMEAEALWNAGAYDRARTNLEVNLAASGARALPYTSADQLNVNAHMLHVILDITAISIGSVTLTINATDPSSEKYYPLLGSVAPR